MCSGIFQQFVALLYRKGGFFSLDYVLCRSNNYSYHSRLFRFETTSPVLLFFDCAPARRWSSVIQPPGRGQAFSALDLFSFLSLSLLLSAAAACCVLQRESYLSIVLLLLCALCVNSPSLVKQKKGPIGTEYVRHHLQICWLFVAAAAMLTEVRSNRVTQGDECDTRAVIFFRSEIVSSSHTLDGSSRLCCNAVPEHFSSQIPQAQQAVRNVHPSDQHCLDLLVVRRLSVGTLASPAHRLNRSQPQ